MQIVCCCFISAPSQLTVIKADIMNSSQVQIEWEAPLHSNGPLTSYQIMAFYETVGGLLANQSWNSSVEKLRDKFTMVCPSDVVDYLVVNYTVSAISYDKDTEQYFHGPRNYSSSSVNKHMCKPESVYGNHN